MANRHMRLAVADPNGTILLIDHVPAGHRLIGCGSLVALRQALRRAAEWEKGGDTLRVPGAANDLAGGIASLRDRIASTLQPVPDRWRARLGEAPRSIELPVWMALRAATGPLSVGDLRRAIDARGTAIALRLSLWEAAGLVERTPDDGRFVLTASAPALPPRINRAGAVTARTPTGTERLWRAMRTLTRHGPFDLPILSITAGTSMHAASAFLNNLHRGGYLHQVSRGNGARGTYSTYLLARDTGPRAPSIKHHRVDGRLRKILVDGNTGARVDVSPGAVSLRSKSGDPCADGGVS